MSTLKLVIFDCDGVLFDSKEANRHYYNHILKRFGHQPMNEEELAYVHTHHVMDSIRHIFRHYPEDFSAAEEYRKSVDYSHFLKFMIMEPDLLDFLRFVRKEHRTAISTNRTNTMSTVLEMFNLAPYFDKVITALDVENSKPHPEALLKILHHFSCKADEAIFIGDSVIDQQHAAGAGVPLIAFKNVDLTAEYHVNSFSEIQQLPFFT